MLADSSLRSWAISSPACHLASPARAAFLKLRAPTVSLFGSAGLLRPKILTGMIRRLFQQMPGTPIRLFVRAPMVPATCVPAGRSGSRRAGQSGLP